MTWKNNNSSTRPFGPALLGMIVLGVFFTPAVSSAKFRFGFRGSRPPALRIGKRVLDKVGNPWVVNKFLSNGRVLLKRGGLFGVELRVQRAKKLTPELTALRGIRRNTVVVDKSGQTYWVDGVFADGRVRIRKDWYFGPITFTSSVNRVFARVK